MIKGTIFCILFLFNGGFLKAQDSITLNNIFKAGENGYACYRIPAIIKTNKGTLLAFAEGRKNNCGDAGDIDIVLRRSYDGGQSWSALNVVWDNEKNTCGNPAPVVEQETGKIFLLSTWNLGEDHEADIIQSKSIDTRRVYVLQSGDEGNTWTAPLEITGTVKEPQWTWYATGPCNGIQIQKGTYKGRLIVPCDHIEKDTKKYYSHIIFSDDKGENWKLGGSTPADMVNECTVAEIPNSTLLLNMRNYSKSRLRFTSTSIDGGLSWSSLQADSILIEPVCQASLLRYVYKNRKPFLTFSNPASTKERKNLTVRFSYSNGKQWERSQVLYAGPAAYSSLVVLPNGNIACLYEAGIKSPYEGIVFNEIKISRHSKVKKAYKRFRN